MNVTTDGEFILLAGLPKYLRQKLGWAPTKKTVIRWVTKGVCAGAAVLQRTRVCGRYCTTPEWLDEFFAAQSAYRDSHHRYAARMKAHAKQRCNLRRSKSAQKAHDRAMKRLAVVYGRTPGFERRAVQAV